MKKRILFLFLTLTFVFSFVSTGAGAAQQQALSQVKFRELVTVQGGAFKQQFTDNTAFNHTITTFLIGRYEVTYELWYAVRQYALSNGYTFQNAGKEGSSGTDGAEPTSAKYEPVTEVSWRDVIVWCNALSEMEGLKPVYTHNGSVIKNSGDANKDACDNAQCNWTYNGYRLPTEGEWQFAASNRGKTPYNYASGAAADYNNEDATGAVAVYNINSGGKTANVGTKKPNALGIYDMSGNVWEWCWDWHGDYPQSAKGNYRGAYNGSYRVWRGGSWYYSASGLQVGNRGSYYPDYRSINVGFRVSMTN